MTGLERKAQLRRTALRRTGIRTTTPGRVARPRDTGPTQATKDALWARAGGLCEINGCQLNTAAGFSRHHRRPRGMGGTTRVDTNDLTNLLLVCGSGTTGCHGVIESQRTMARGYGWLVRQHENPADIPVLVRSRLVWLTADGSYAADNRPRRAGQ